jgi:hypothetical protein
MTETACMVYLEVGQEKWECTCTWTEAMLQWAKDMSDTRLAELLTTTGGKTHAVLEAEQAKRIRVLLGEG